MGGVGQHEVVDWPGRQFGNERSCFLGTTIKKERNRDYLDLIEWIIKLDLVQN